MRGYLQHLRQEILRKDDLGNQPCLLKLLGGQSLISQQQRGGLLAAHGSGKGDAGTCFGTEAPFHEWREEVCLGNRVNEVEECDTAGSIPDAWPVDRGDQDFIGVDDQLVVFPGE